MPFRFSEFMKRGKTSNPWEETDRSVSPPTPSSHNSYDFRPSPPPPVRQPSVKYPPSSYPSPPRVPAVPVPTHRPSIIFDNGTGRIDPHLALEQNLPPSIQTTDQLAQYLKTRGNQQQDRASAYSSSAASQYSRTSSRAGTGTDVQRPDSASSYYATPSRKSASTTRSNTTVPSRYKGRSVGAPQPVARILPGTTKKHKFEGYWLARGTLRRTEAELKDGKSRKANNARPATAASQNVETSYWYDSD